MPRSLLDTATKDSFGSRLVAAVECYHFNLEPAQTCKLLVYLELLMKWNSVYNLTSIRDPKDMLVRHLIDSLSIAPYLQGDNVLDVGTGAGLPGIPLAIVFADVEFQLLDSNIKKTRFLTQCKIELGLENVQISHGRVEDTHLERNFDQIVSRAFTSLGNMVSLCSHLLEENGKFLAMKGREPAQETLPQPYKIEQTLKLDVPGCEEQRHLIIIGKSG